MQLLKSFLPSMMEKNHGHIVSVASIAGLVGAYQLTDYCSSKFAAVGLEESLRLELNCDGYDGIHSTVVCPYYINTGMFAGIGRSLIPILTPEYVVNETVKAILVNQEVLCLPDLVYWIIVFRACLPTKSFLWLHRAIGAANTMKSFTGRTPQQQQAVAAAAAAAAANKNLGAQDVAIKMKPDTIGITIPEPNELTSMNGLTQ